MQKNTLLTISRNTGFSVSTVSRVLSGKAGKARISSKTCARIKEEAERLNYRPDMLAQSLRTGRTNTVGLVVPSIDNPFFAFLASYIVKECRTRGLNLLLADSMEDEHAERESVKSFLSQKVDGLVIVPCGLSPDFLEEVSLGVPVVLVDRHYSRSALPYVCTDNWNGGRIVAEYMLDCGLKDILAIQGIERSSASIERVGGFKETMKERGASPFDGFGDLHFSIKGDSFSVENGYTCTKAALESEKHPDGIFAMSSTILLGAIKAIREKGLRIPEDIRLVSFDHNNFLDYMDPAVTRVEQPLSEIGRKAIEKLTELMSGNSSIETQTLLEPTLVKRRSC